MTENSAMVAGPGELTLAARYHVSIGLPMPEDDFLRLLNRLRLHYEICGDRKSDLDMPPARHQTSVDLSQAQICYEIYGPKDAAKRSAEAWRAFVDQERRVFYVETSYAYGAY